jgi:two-component sensor histidine kinase
LRRLLGLLAFLLAVPTLALAVALGALQVRAARERLEVAARDEARAVLQRADALLARHLAELRRVAAIATPGALSNSRAPDGPHLALIAPGGAVLADTRPSEARLPQAITTQLAARDHLVSPLVEDPASGGHALLLAVPVGRDLLTLAVPAAAFQGLLAGPGLGPFDASRFPALIDAEGQVVARWLEADRFVGQRMSESARATLLGGPEGVWQGQNLVGEEVMVAHAVSPLSGLSVGMGVTQAALRAPLWHSALVLGPAAAALLLLAVAATLLVARRIGEPMRSLGVAAAALADGRPVPRLATPVAEVNAVAAAMADAAEKRQAAEEQRDLLVRELHHRVKNLLATAQSLATLSARSARDPAGFTQQFGDRLRALARTHTMLLEEPGGVVGLAALVTAVVAPYRMGLGRIAIAGPEVKLPAESAVPLGMVLHELATNAVKYGSLSLTQGRLEVAWRLEGKLLRLDWTESNGPEVEQPEREGFGSQLLRRALAGLPGGEVKVDWRPEGLMVRMALRVA